MAQIIVHLLDDGTTKIEGQGFIGKECDQKMKPFEEALGLGDEGRTNSPEYYAYVDNKTKVKV